MKKTKVSPLPKLPQENNKAISQVGIGTEPDQLLEELFSRDERFIRELRDPSDANKFQYTLVYICKPFFGSNNEGLYRNLRRNAVYIAEKFAATQCPLPRYLAVVIYSLGKLAAELANNADVAIDLAEALSRNRDANAHDFANTIWGLANLVVKEKISKNVTVTSGGVARIAPIVINLMERLNGPSQSRIQNPIIPTGNSMELVSIPKSSKKDRADKMPEISREGASKITTEIAVQNYSNVIWGMAKLAREEVFSQPEIIHIIGVAIQLAEKVLGRTEKNAQNCANVVWGLATLVETAKQPLPEQDWAFRISDIVITLAEQLQVLQEAEERNYANTVWGVAKLVELSVLSLGRSRSGSKVHGCDRDARFARTVINLAEMLVNKFSKLNVSFGRMEAQNCSCVLWSLTKLVECGQLFLDNGHVSSVVNIVIALAEKLLQQSKGYNIGYNENHALSVFSLAKLVEKLIEKKLLESGNNGPAAVIADKVIGLVGQIVTGNEISMRDCTNALWGLVKLIEVRALFLSVYCSQRGSQGVAQSAHIASLVSTLVSRIIPQQEMYAQNCAKTIWSLAYLAVNTDLFLFMDGGNDSRKKIASVVLLLAEHLLQLGSQDMNAQDCANAIWGLGRMAESGRLPWSQDDVAHIAVIVIGLVRKLVQQREVNAQCCANSIWGLAKLAELGKSTLFEENGANVTSAVCELAKILQSAQQRLSAQNYSNTIWGLPKLVEVKLLSLNATNCNEIINLVVALANNLHNEQGASAQNYANAIAGLAEMVEAGVLYLSAENITRASDGAIALAQKLQCQQGINAQNCGSAIWSLTKLAEMSKSPKLSNIIGIEMKLAEKLQGQAEVSAQNYASAIWGITKLVVREPSFLSKGGAASIIGIVVALAEKLSVQKDVAAQNYANAIWSLTHLAEMVGGDLNKIRGKVRSVVQNLFAAFQAKIPLQELSQASSSWGLVVCQQIVQGLSLLNTSGIQLQPFINILTANCPKSSSIHMLVFKLLQQESPRFGECYKEYLLFGYFVDIYFPARNLVVEIDGAWHDDKDQQIIDCHRDNILKKRGCTIIRVDLKSITNDCPGIPDDELAKKIVQQIEVKSGTTLSSVFSCSSSFFENKQKMPVPQLCCSQRGSQGTAQIDSSEQQPEHAGQPAAEQSKRQKKRKAKKKNRKKANGVASTSSALSPLPMGY